LIIILPLFGSVVFYAAQWQRFSAKTTKPRLPVHVAGLLHTN
jgi:hypothetical protein